MNCRLLNVLIVLFPLIACDRNPLPVMGSHSVLEVDVKELSGLCLDNDALSLLACGDKGVVKSISFNGETTDIWTRPSDMEGITMDPSTGDIYLAIEGKQEVHLLAAPAYSSQKLAFAVKEAVDGVYNNSGLEAVEYYKDGILFVGSQKDANLWQYNVDGTMISKVSLSSFASEIAGLCYDSQSGRLWVTDSKKAMIFVCTPDGTLIASYDVSYIHNAESICVDRSHNCVWVASDEDSTKLYRIAFNF